MFTILKSVIETLSILNIHGMVKTHKNHIKMYKTNEDNYQELIEAIFFFLFFENFGVFWSLETVTLLLIYFYLQPENPFLVTSSFSNIT